MKIPLLKLSLAAGAALGLTYCFLNIPKLKGLLPTLSKQSLSSAISSPADISLKTQNSASPTSPSIPYLPDNPDITQDTSAYKWVDERGVVHYSDAAPEHGETVKLIRVNPDTNLVQGIHSTAEVSAPTEPYHPADSLPDDFTNNPINHPADNPIDNPIDNITNTATTPIENMSR